MTSIGTGNHTKVDTPLAQQVHSEDQHYIRPRFGTPNLLQCKIITTLEQ